MHSKQRESKKHTNNTIISKLKRLIQLIKCDNDNYNGKYTIKIKVGKLGLEENHLSF